MFTALSITRPARDRRPALSSTARNVDAALITTQPLLELFRALSTLAEAGVTVDHAVAVVLTATTNPKLRLVLRSVLDDLKNDPLANTPLADAFAKHPKCFSPFVLAIVCAAETHGNLPDALVQLSAALDAAAALRKRVDSAFAFSWLSYTGCLILALLPFLAILNAGMHGASLAASSLNADNHYQTTIIGVFASIGLLLCAVGMLREMRGGRKAITNLFLRSPVAGPLLRKEMTANIARAAEIILRTGTPTDAAIDVGLPVDKGLDLIPAIEAVQVFDAVDITLVRTTGPRVRLPDTLHQIAARAEVHIAPTIDNLPIAIKMMLAGTFLLTASWLVNHI